VAQRKLDCWIARHFLAACNVMRLIAKGGAFRGLQPIRSASSTMIPSGPRT
jgi:hypothetical protein